MTTRAGPDVEGRAVAHGLGDAERDRHQVDEQRRPQPERDRHRQLLDDQVDDAAVPEEALAEVERERSSSDHAHEALGGGRSKPYWRSSWRISSGSMPRAPRYLSATSPAGRRLGPRSGLAAAGAADPRRRVDGRALEAGDHQLDRPAGRGLDDDEVDEHDAEERGDDQQEAADDVGEHRRAPRLLGNLALAPGERGLLLRVDPPGVEPERVLRARRRGRPNLSQ